MIRTLLLATAVAGFLGAPARAQYPAADALPPFEIATIVRSAGMDPLHRPVWKNGFYVLRAINPYGEEMRVIVNGRSGRIVSIRPVGEDVAVRPAPRDAYPTPDDDDDDDGEFYDENGRRLVPPRVTPPAVSAPRERPETRSAAIDPSALPLPRPKPAEAVTQPADAKPATQSARKEPEPPPVPQGPIRKIEIYKKPQLPSSEAEEKKNDSADPPVAPLEDTPPKPNL